MGVPNLKEAISEAIISNTNLFNIALKFYLANNRPLTLAIDVSIYYFHFLKISQSQSIHFQQLQWILGKFMIFLTNLLKLNIVPYLVLDGSDRPSFKRNKAIRTTLNSQGTPFIEGLTQLAKCLSLELIQAPGEAEAQCAYLQKSGYVDYVLTDDIDAIVFGATRVLCNYKNISKGNNNNTYTTVSVIDMKTVNSMYNIDTVGLVLVALFSGGDYNVEGLKNAGIRMAMEVANSNTKFSQRLIDIFRLSDPGATNWNDTQRAMLRRWHCDIISQCRKQETNMVPLPRSRRFTRKRGFSNVVLDESEEEIMESELLHQSTSNSWHFSRRYNVASLPDNFPEFSHMELYISPLIDVKCASRSSFHTLPGKIPKINFRTLRQFTYTMLTEEWSYGITADKGRVAGQWKFIKFFTELMVMQRLLYDTVSSHPPLFTIINEQSLDEGSGEIDDKCLDEHQIMKNYNYKELRVETSPFSLFSFEAESDPNLIKKRVIRTAGIYVEVGTTNGDIGTDGDTEDDTDSSHLIVTKPEENNIHSTDDNRKGYNHVNMNDPYILKRIWVPAYLFSQSPTYKSLLKLWNQIKVEKVRKKFEKKVFKKTRSAAPRNSKSKYKRSIYDPIFGGQKTLFDLGVRVHKSPVSKDTKATFNRTLVRSSSDYSVNGNAPSEISPAQKDVSDETPELLVYRPETLLSDYFLSSNTHSRDSLDSKIHDDLSGRCSSQDFQDMGISTDSLPSILPLTFPSSGSDSVFKSSDELPLLKPGKNKGIVGLPLSLRRTQSEMPSAFKFSMPDTSDSKLNSKSSQNKKKDNYRPLFPDFFINTNDINFDGLDSFSIMNNGSSSSIISDQNINSSRDYTPSNINMSFIPKISSEKTYRKYYNSKEFPSFSKVDFSRLRKTNIKSDCLLNFNAQKISCLPSNNQKQIFFASKDENISDASAERSKGSNDSSIIIENDIYAYGKYNTTYVAISDDDDDAKLSGIGVNQDIPPSHGPHILD